MPRRQGFRLKGYVVHRNEKRVDIIGEAAFSFFLVGERQGCATDEVHRSFDAPARQAIGKLAKETA